jgi:hypothetical protein
MVPNYYLGKGDEKKTKTKNILYHSHKNISVSLDGRTWSKPADLVLSSVISVISEDYEFSFVVNPKKGPHQVCFSLFVTLHRTFPSPVISSIQYP